MKIGNQSNKKNFLKNKRSANILIILLVSLILFFSGAIFQQRGLSSSLVEFIFETRTLVSRDLNLYRSNGLQTIYLDIPFNTLDAIQKKRQEALSLGILISSDEDFMPAELQIGNQPKVEIEIRLKGDWTDHLETDKWSYRVHVKDGQYVLGMKRFSLQSPETRNHLAEWAFHQACQQANILTTGYTFVNVVENGVYKGIYALEESFSEELLARQGQREGLILKFDEDVFWEESALFEKDGNRGTALTEGFLSISGSYISSDVEVFRDGYLEQNPTLSRQKVMAMALLRAYLEGDLPAERVFDLEKMGAFFALTDYWSANHAVHWINLRFYFNPVTALLEPVVYDGIPLTFYTVDRSLGFEMNASIDLYNNPIVRMIYLNTLRKITTENELLAFRESQKNEYARYLKAIEREYGKLPSIWDQMEKRRRMVSAAINPARMLRGTYHLSTSEVNRAASLKIQLKNLTIFPVTISAVTVNGISIPFQPDMLDGDRPQDLITTVQGQMLDFNKGAKLKKLPEINLSIPGDLLPEQPPETVSVQAKFPGSAETVESLLSGYHYSIELLTHYPQVGLPSLAEVREQHPFLRLNADNNLVVPAGDWQVKGDLALPENYSLILTAGAHLSFENGAILLINGGCLQLKGTPDAVVSLTAQDENWGGILVINAPEQSRWQYSHISKIAGFDRDGWMVTGGITFYQSDIDIQDSMIFISTAEDALNVIHGYYLFSNLTIKNTLSDAFDADFTTGEIYDCYFEGISGDAVDVSGSHLLLANTTFRQIDDKAISAGEQSEVSAYYLDIKQANIGIASKDNSHVLIQESQITSSTYTALAAYTKKNEFGAASIEAVDVFIDNLQKQALVQTDSQIRVDGILIPTRELDVDTLYDLGILGN